MEKAKVMKRNKKLLAITAVALAVITLVAGTFAWIQSKDDVLNELSTRQITDNAVVIQEIFTSPPSWDPDMTVDKQVWVTNTGDSKALVRVSFEEILYLLKNGGMQTETNTYNDSSVLTGQTDPEDNWIPVQVDITAYTAWTALTAAQIDASQLANPASLTDPLAGVTILMQETVSASGDRSIGYFAYRTVSAGVYQKVKLGQIETVLYTQAEADAGTIPAGSSVGTFKQVKILGADPEGTPADKNIKFCWYEGRTMTQDRTANTTKYVTNTATLLSPGFTPTFNGTPAVIMDSPLDAAAMLGASKIKINFANTAGTPNVTTNLATAVANKCWYYNATDGYFYYMDTVGAGAASKQLISSLKLDGSASIEHSLMDYKLGILSDAIQNTETAISSATGWNIPNGGVATDLGYQLAQLCDN